MDYKNKYYWSFQIETSRFGGVMGASCDYVTEENREAWQRLIQNKINELMKPGKQSFRAVLCTLIYISTFVPNLNFGQDEHKRRRQVL